jgi:hypothetical protein
LFFPGIYIARAEKSMQANDQHLFLCHDRCLYVFYRGALVQTLVRVCGEKLWLTPFCLISLTTGDTDCDLCVWGWDKESGKLTRCRRFPNPPFIVDFAGLWQNHVVLCSASGTQACYDILNCHQLPAHVFPAITAANRDVPGYAYQDIVTVWPDRLRTLNWIRRDDVHEGLFYDRTIGEYRRADDKAPLGVQNVCMTTDTVWGYETGYDLHIKCWSRRNLKLRMPQLAVLIPTVPGILVEKLFIRLWPHALGRLQAERLGLVRSLRSPYLSGNSVF